MVNKCPLSRKFSRKIGTGGKRAEEDKKGELLCGLMGCPETDVAHLGFGGVGDAESPLKLVAGDAAYPVYQICFIKKFGYTGGGTSNQPQGLTICG